jgi:two-component system KDP operon response regulator KdpE
MSEPTMTVVLIDDEKNLRRFVRAALEAEGMAVFEASTG